MNEDETSKRIMANPRVQRAFEERAQKLRESGGHFTPATDAEHQAVLDELDAEWKQVKQDPEFIALMKRRLKEKQRYES